MATISGLINARLRSTRLPQKLIRPFAGTTLIDIALEKLNQMDFFEHRYFGAEDELTSRSSKFENIELLQREMASVEPGYNEHSVIYAHYEKIQSDYICWINPCHSLLSIDTLKRACDHVQETLHNSYTSVIPTRDWIFSAEGESITNTSDIVSTNHSCFFVWRMASIYSGKISFWKSISPDYDKNDPAIYEVPAGEAFDVDTPTDFKIAEMAYLDAQSGSNMHSKTDFDIIILVGYFRSAHQSLSIISSLAKTLRIGLVMADLSDDLSAKIDKTQNQFRELCLNFGAASVSLSEIVSCRLLVVAPICLS